MEGKDSHVQPLLVPCSTHQNCFLKFPLSLINITVCTQAALINQLQMAILKMAVATTVSNLQSAFAAHMTGMVQRSCEQAAGFLLFFFFYVRGGNPALFRGYTSLSPQGRIQWWEGQALAVRHSCMLMSESSFLLSLLPCSMLCTN